MEYVLIDCGLIHKYLVKKSEIESLENTTFYKAMIVKEFKNPTIDITKGGLILNCDGEVLKFKRSSDPELKYFLDEIVRCNDCKYCEGTVYGDKEEFICSKGYYKKFKLNIETDCKGFRFRISK